MRKYAKYVVIGFVCIIFIIVGVTIQMVSMQREQTVTVNDDIIQVQNFSIRADSSPLDTFANGTVFVKGNSGEVNSIQIVASVEIDPEDWGGVAFYIPAQWRISNIVSSYPDNEAAINLSQYITTWTTDTPSINQWDTMIEIGRSHDYQASKGGSGTVVIDIIPDRKQPRDMTIGVEVGSETKENYKVKGTDFIVIPISFT